MHFVEMSESGQKRKSVAATRMSAVGGRADEISAITDIGQQMPPVAAAQRQRHRDQGGAAPRQHLSDARVGPAYSREVAAALPGTNSASMAMIYFEYAGAIGLIAPSLNFPEPLKGNRNMNARLENL